MFYFTSRATWFSSTKVRLTPFVCMVIEFTSAESPTNSLSALFGYSTFNSWPDENIFRQKIHRLRPQHDIQVGKLELTDCVWRCSSRWFKSEWVMGDGLLLSGVVSCFCEEEGSKQTFFSFSSGLLRLLSVGVCGTIRASSAIACRRYVTSYRMQVFGFIVLSEFWHSGTNPSQTTLLITR